MGKIEFEQAILEVLKKFGYKTKGIRNLSINLEVEDIPEISIDYTNIN